MLMSSNPGRREAMTCMLYCMATVKTIVGGMLRLNSDGAGR